MKKLSLFLARYGTFEFWPAWLVYLPLIPYWLWLCVKSRSLTYFTAANPGIEMGGLVGESKTDILKKIDPNYLPVTLLFSAHTPLSEVLAQLSLCSIHFPCIAKPDVGERGYRVAKIQNPAQLKQYLSHAPGDFIIQEYLHAPLEFGVFFYRLPGQPRGKVTSVTAKEFLTVTGDGCTSIRELLNRQLRGRFQLARLEKEMGPALRRVPAPGESVLLEPIGNHCRGTRFVNANYLINEQLNEVFSRIAAGIGGFYYGRFDLKVSTLDDLYAGRNIKIMELNGISSEPTHIYDSRTSLRNAYRALFYHSDIIYRISQKNRKQGLPFMPVHKLVKKLWQYYQQKNKATKKATDL